MVGEQDVGIKYLLTTGANISISDERYASLAVREVCVSHDAREGGVGLPTE